MKNRNESEVLLENIVVVKTPATNENKLQRGI